MANLNIGLGAVITDNNLSGASVNAALKTRVGEFGGTFQDDGKEVKGLATWTVKF